MHLVLSGHIEFQRREKCCVRLIDKDLPHGNIKNEEK